MELNPNFDTTYEPKTLNDIVFTQHQQRNNMRDVVTGRNPFPANGKNGILLVGDTGSGKSTLAKLLPDWIEVARGGDEAYPIYHQITSSNGGVTLLEQIENRVKLVLLGQKFHYIVLDEVDLLSTTAMDKLKSVMNIAYKSCIWIMTTNDYGRISAPVVNRCHTYFLNHAPSTQWLPLFNRILSDHDITDISEAEMLEQIDMCNGSGRAVIEAAKRIILDRTEAVTKPTYHLTANVV
jgi:replication-associated recombination protein RarA